jgi:RNA polymerase I-specific transcription initiation factor RRN7
MRGLPKELETIVRDLWDLRVRIMQASRDAKSSYGSGTAEFSSTSEGDNTDTDGTGKKSWASRRSKTTSRNRDRLPKLTETLALCYLGTLLMRLPISLGEIYKWAAKEEMIYTRAVSFNFFPCLPLRNE